MQALIGEAHHAGGLSVAAFVLLLAPANILLGGAVMAVVAASGKDPRASKLAKWLRANFPGALLWLAATIVVEALLLPVPGRQSISMASMPGPGLVPWLIHAGLASVAVSGWLTALHGREQSRRDEEYGAWAVSWGLRWFAIPTALQMVAGFYLLLALPGSIRSRLMGGDALATAELVLAILLAIAVFSVVTHALNAVDPGRYVAASGLLLGATLVAMGFLRDQVRIGTTEPASAPGGPITPSTGETLLAATLTAAMGAGLTWWLVRRVKAPPPA